ncbi:MAG: hypothetical protein N4A48_05505 [Tepidibacter sp.]|jgi:hypothetical protein|uniref:hypothetical protein n=1 Tax=Tepidibacter sp. TaxID=2529387 RepID=UPI0025F9999A|nr:hypothetical protein [Tepidibacter sp.]MCT4508211.1 hypothetical protein [Tepidibacter sp.]
MEKCSRFKHCGFIKKYKDTGKYNNLIEIYCKGKKKEKCKRKEFNEKNGYSPDDNMLPNGKIGKLK